MEDTDTQETVVTEKDQNNKLEKKFQSALNKLVAVVGGQKNLKIPTKTPNDKLTEIVEELFEEERTKALFDTREGLRNLLKKYAEMDKAVKEKQQELEKLHKQKKEEFVKAADALFNRIEDVGTVERSYYEALKVATSAPSGEQNVGALSGASGSVIVTSKKSGKKL